VGTHFSNYVERTYPFSPGRIAFLDSYDYIYDRPDVVAILPRPAPLPHPAARPAVGLARRVQWRELQRGRTRFDGDTVSQDACRGPSTSTKDGNQPNCGYAARSRSLRACERLPSPAYGRGPDVILVGWL